MVAHEKMQATDEAFPCGCVAREFRSPTFERVLLVGCCGSAEHRGIQEAAAFDREYARRSGEWRGRLDNEPWQPRPLPGVVS